MPQMQFGSQPVSKRHTIQDNHRDLDVK